MEKAFNALLNPMTLLMGMMAVGFLVGRLGVFGKEFNQALAFFLLKITLPSMIFVSFQRPFEGALALQALWVFLLSLGCYGFYFLVSFGSTRLLGNTEGRRGVYRFALLFSNVGFMGFPLVSALLGKSMIFFAAIFNIPFQFLVFTLGVMIITEGQKKEPDWWKEVVLNPGIIATVGGFLFFLGSVALPMPLFLLADGLGNLTTPLSMVLIGSILAQSPVKQLLQIRSLWVISFIRLLIIPLGVGALTLFIPIDHNLKLLAILLSAMPAAANTPLFAAHYRVSEIPSGQIVFLTTALSVLTIPLFALFWGIGQ